MKKVKLSLAALSLVLAIAGTTTVNATNSKVVGPCSTVDPGGTECLNQTDQECCFDEILQQVINTKINIPH